MSIFDTLTTEDNKLLVLLDEAKENHNRILDLFAQRVNLYKKCAEQADNPMERAIIEAKKMVIMSDMGLLSAQYAIQEEIKKINSRLGALEKNASLAGKTS